MIYKWFTFTDSFGLYRIDNMQTVLAFSQMIFFFLHVWHDTKVNPVDVKSF